MGLLFCIKDFISLGHPSSSWQSLQSFPMYPCATGEEIGCCNRGAIEIGEPNALCCWCFQNQKNSGGHYSTLLWSTSLENSEWSNSSALSASTAASAGAVVRLLLQSKISRFLTCPLLFLLVGQQFLFDLLRLPIVSKSVPCSHHFHRWRGCKWSI